MSDDSAKPSTPYAAEPFALRKRARAKDPIPYNLSKYPLDRSKREGYLSKYGIRTCPYKKIDIQALADQMIMWVYDNQDALAIEDFPLSIIMSPRDFMKLGDDNKHMSAAIDITRCMIGSRLQKLAREGAIDQRVAMKILPLYHGEYRDFLTARIKDFNRGTDSQPIKIVLEEFGSTSVVPTKLATD